MLSGTFAGRYTIERELGRGATATVYLARDTQRNRTVAIKLLRTELAETVGAERFLREIKLNEQLQHSHIVQVLDSGEHEGQLYFVLPWMEGGSLRQLLQREKQLPIETAVTITRTIADALHYAHQKGLIHRDVKPENILFSSGQACLGDFGIARAIERAIDASTTETGLVRGTPAYMSPEQASGSRQYDGRSDVYSLACVLYEMLAGVQAFIGPTAEVVIAQRFQHTPRELRVYRPSVSPALEACIQGALALSPADRYATAADFSSALDGAMRAPQIEPRTSGPTMSLPRSMRFATLGSIALVGLVAALLFMVPRRSTNSVESVPVGDPRRIAVLYFDDLTPNALPPHVADGITEDLIDVLSRVRALHVISPNGVRTLRGQVITPDSAGRAFGVGTLVSGSVAKSGNTLRLNVRLIDAKSGRQLYSRTLEQPWTELFTLQDKLADQVAFFLRQRLGDAIALSKNRAGTKSYEAWDLVQLAGEATQRGLRGATLRNDPAAQNAFLQADSLYARAALLDPSWVFPIVKRGHLALALRFQSPVGPEPTDLAYAKATPAERRVIWIRRSIQLADEALAKDGSSAEALALRGDGVMWLAASGAPGSDSLNQAAGRDLRRAVELRPDNASAWASLAQVERFAGHFPEAAAAAERAYEADAYFEVPRIASVGYMAALHAGLESDASRWCEMGLERYAGDPRFTECRLTILGWNGRGEQDVADALRLLHQIETRDSTHILDATWTYRRLMLAALLARSGKSDSARTLVAITHAAQQPPANKRASPMTEAYVQLLLHQPDSAIALLEQHLRENPQTRPQIAKHPWFRDLRDDPRFIALSRVAR